MLPIIALIGRTNVGKSTLFNILTRKRNALVANYPGLTRDRQYGSFYLQENIKVLLIDTAGMDIVNKKIEEKIQKQTSIAIEEAHIILFIVNAQDGLMPQELEIAKRIRKYEKETVLIINKIDGSDTNSIINDFYSLGFENNYFISAAHNYGIKKLISKHLIPWIKNNFFSKKLSYIVKNPVDHINSIKIAFIGKPNVGKSTLINALLKKERMITFNEPGTTLDSISTPFTFNKKNYILIDTAGACKKKHKKSKIEQFSVMKTLQTIEKTNVVLFIINAECQISSQDMSLCNFIINTGKSIVIVINKWDRISVLERKRFKNTIENKLQCISFSRIHFISALYKKGIFELFKSIDEAYDTSQKKINTCKLTKILYEATKKHQPSIIKGRRIKLKYAHLGGSNPIHIIIHGNQVNELCNSYKRYLTNFFYNDLKIKGAPIKMTFKETINPYIKKYKN